MVESNKQLADEWHGGELIPNGKLQVVS